MDETLGGVAENPLTIQSFSGISWIVWLRRCEIDGYRMFRRCDNVLEGREEWLVAKMCLLYQHRVLACYRHSNLTSDL